MPRLTVRNAWLAHDYRAPDFGWGLLHGCNWLRHGAKATQAEAPDGPGYGKEKKMGYCYSSTGALVCDGCGDDQGVRKRRCTYGWCQPPALCSHCHTTKPEDHSRCKEPAAKWRANQDRRKELLDKGHYVRSSALGVGSGDDYRVHVLFDNKNGDTIGYYMSKETYDKHPLSVPLVPGDFKKYGEIEWAPATFYDMESTSKRVA